MHAMHMNSGIACIEDAKCSQSGQGRLEPTTNQTGGLQDFARRRHDWRNRTIPNDIYDHDLTQKVQRPLADSARISAGLGRDAVSTLGDVRANIRHLTSQLECNVHIIELVENLICELRRDRTQQLSLPLALQARYSSLTSWRQRKMKIWQSEIRACRLAC